MGVILAGSEEAMRHAFAVTVPSRKAPHEGRYLEHSMASSLKLQATTNDSALYIIQTKHRVPIPDYAHLLAVRQVCCMHVSLGLGARTRLLDAPSVVLSALPFFLGLQS